MRTKFLYFFLFLLLISCGNENEKQSEKQIFRMNLDEGLSTLDPAYARDMRTDWMCGQIFCGLVELDSELKIVPMIAKKWEISEDGKTYTFHLRKDVQFHSHSLFGKDSTRKVVAADFAYSFSRLCDTAVASTGMWLFKGRVEGIADFQKGKTKFVSGFQAKNDTTFVIQLVKPFPPFLNLLSMPYCSVVPHEIVKHYGKEFARNPIGTGAFRFFQWEEGSHLILHKNSHYFEVENDKRLPFLEAIYVQFIPSKLSTFINLVQGKLDFMNDIHNSYKDEVLNSDGTIKANYKDKFQFFLVPQYATHYVGMMTDSSKYTDKHHPLLMVKFRKALNFAINREKLVKYLLNGMGYPTGNFLPPKNTADFTNTNNDFYKYNIEKAKQLLKEAGYENGQNLPEISIYAAPEYAFIIEFLQKEWENIGVKIKIQTMQGGPLRKEIYAAKVQMWRANWLADYPDAENFLFLFHSPNQTPKGPNTTHFRSENYDQMYESIFQITNDSLRQNVYEKMQFEMLDNAPIIPLYYGRIFRMAQKNVHGLGMNAMNRLYLKRTWKS